ncbi:MAG: permease prefix domain 1-containing protein [Phycicoccus sp.]
MSSHVHAAYLTRLDAALVGPRRARRSLIAEAAGHLEDATDAFAGTGLTPDAAARRAVTDFGDVELVAPAFQETLTVASSRRTAWLLLLALGYQPFLWDSGIDLSATLHETPPDPGSVLYATLDRGIELAGGLLIAAALLAVLATGVGRRWLPTARPVARATAAIAVAAAVVLPGLAAAMTVLSGAPIAFWAAGTLLMAVPMAVVAASAHRTWATAG